MKREHVLRDEQRYPLTPGTVPKLAHIVAYVAHLSLALLSLAPETWRGVHANAPVRTRHMRIVEVACIY